jgi:teichuronic acid biosynthesis glycosyltransferase TuaG
MTAPARAPLVSILVATYQRPEWLTQALTSLQAQTDSHWEAVVADDGSGDATAAVLDPIAAADTRVRPMYLPHTGNLSRVRNAAYAAARGSLIAFLDDDDTWLPDKLAGQRRLLAAHPGAPLVCAQVERFGAGNGVWPRDPKPRLVHRDLLRGNQVAVGTVLARRSAFPPGPPFDESLPHVAEYAVWLSLAASGNLICERRVVARYRIHAGGMSRERELELRELELLYDRLEDAGVPPRYLSPGRRGILRGRARLARTPAAALARWLAALRPGTLPGRGGHSPFGIGPG